jgi:hypothetical protein
MDNPRFNQLLELARNGDEAAVASLWWEFDFDFHAEVPPSMPHAPCGAAPQGGASC